MDIMLSVNCIAYNQEEYIGQALESILSQQTDFRYEILVHDDASTDGTASVIRRYAEDHPDVIKPIYQTENQHSKGIRVGTVFNLSRACGKYLAYCEGDDYWTDPLKLKKQVDYMESHPDCGFCFHAVQVVNRQGRSTGQQMRPFRENRVVPIESIIEGGGRFLGTNSTVYRRELMNQPPDFYLKAPVGDFPLVLYLATQGTVYYFDEVMSAYRSGVPGSWTARMIASTEQQMKVRKGMIEMINAFDEYTDHKYGASVEVRQTEYDLLLLIAQGDIKALQEDRYKQYRDKLGFYLVILMYLNKYFPRLFHKLRKYHAILMGRFEKPVN
jgi:glycosyltransferase involved in cell wall biosynthesis